MYAKECSLLQAAHKIALGHSKHIRDQVAYAMLTNCSLDTALMPYDVR